MGVDHVVLNPFMFGVVSPHVEGGGQAGPVELWGMGDCKGRRQHVAQLRSGRRGMAHRVMGAGSLTSSPA